MFRPGETEDTAPRFGGAATINGTSQAAVQRQIIDLRLSQRGVTSRLNSVLLLFRRARRLPSGSAGRAGMVK